MQGVNTVCFLYSVSKIGWLYFKVTLAYRFKEALCNLEPVQKILDKGIHCKVYPWPGMTAVIKESKSEILKVSLYARSLYVSS